MLVKYLNELPKEGYFRDYLKMNFYNLNLGCRVSVLLSIFATQIESNRDFSIETGYFPCPCLHPAKCPSLPPYGESALDILLFGTHGPCPRFGEIRCCPRTSEPFRAEWDKFYEALNSSADSSGPDSNIDLG